MASIVVDIGGTNLRVGCFADGALHSVRRMPVENALRHPDVPSETLYDRFVDQLQAALAPLLDAYPAAPIGLSFPGPIDAEGRVAQAPTLWREALRDVPLHADLSARLRRPLWLLNDISAAVWRYAEAGGPDFCLITISSGIGNKVYRAGQILLSEEGQGGEIGHCQVVADGPLALPCDCGGRGHLAALASGRGTIQLARALAGDALAARSSLAASPPGDWTTERFVAALHAGDPFARHVLRASQTHLVAAMRQLYHWIGIRRFIFIGGFATAIGAPYLAGLNALLAEERWFGLPPEAMTTLCQLGAPDDDHSLIGMGRYIAAQGGR